MPQGASALSSASSPRLGQRPLQLPPPSIRPASCSSCEFPYQLRQLFDFSMRGPAGLVGTAPGAGSDVHPLCTRQERLVFHHIRWRPDAKKTRLPKDPQRTKNRLDRAQGHHITERAGGA